MNTETYIQRIAKLKYPIIIICSIIFFVVFFYYRKNNWVVSISFYNTSSENIEYDNVLKDGKFEITANKDELQRILSFGYSKQLFDFILGKFNLISYYHVNTNNTNYIQTTMSIFKSHYTFDINERNEIVITITDKDKEMAYDIAKAVMFKVNNINNTYLKNAKQIQLDICKKELEYLNAQRDNTLMQIGKVSKDKNNKNLFDNTILNANISLIEKQIFEYNYLKYKIVSSIYLLENKVPILITETINKQNPFTWTTLLWSLVATFNTFVMLICIVIAELRYRKYLKILFNTNNKLFLPLNNGKNKSKVTVKELETK